MPARRLNPERGEHEAVSQQGRWAPKEGGLEGLTSIGERKRVPARKLSLEGGGL